MRFSIVDISAYNEKIYKHKINHKIQNQDFVVRTKDYFLCHLTFANKIQTVRK